MDETTDSAPICPAQMPFSGQRTDSTQDGSGDDQPRHGSMVHVRAELDNASGQQGRTSALLNKVLFEKPHHAWTRPGKDLCPCRDGGQTRGRLAYEWSIRDGRTLPVRPTF